MDKQYSSVVTRFLRPEERLFISDEKEMPLVIEATNSKSSEFLQNFLKDNAEQLIQDLAHYGAILLRGFDIHSDETFEKIVLSIPQFRGISDAFMAENGRTHVGDLKYVLHTNSVYKTGGTLYLGGFHTENYYSPDVPGFISFFCLEPSQLGGETGIINTQKIYSHFNDELKQKLEKNAYFVCQWLVTEVATRYQISTEEVELLCKKFDLPIVGEGDERFVLMYKPSVFIHPLTQEKALQINLFELPTLNNELRRCFIADYQGKPWFWHRFFWRLPMPIFNAIEHIAVACIAFFKSPKNACKIMFNQFAALIAKKKLPALNQVKVGSCFNAQEIKDLAKLMRQYYSSCLWQKGDILLVDNRKVMHAGMPGKGERVIRALICNPVELGYSWNESGCILSSDREKGAIVSDIAH